MSDVDDKLDQLIRSLPREKASSNFTAEVLARLSRPEIERPIGGFARRPLVWVAAVSVVIVVLAAMAYRGHHERLEHEHALQHELMAIRSEYKTVIQQFDALRQEARDRNTVYLGSDDQSDYVIDLTKFADPPAQDTRPAVCPADLGVAGAKNNRPLLRERDSWNHGGII